VALQDGRGQPGGRDGGWGRVAGRCRTWLEHGRAEGDLMGLNGWIPAQMLTRYSASARGARSGVV
jgi:hypothetical protein